MKRTVLILLLSLAGCSVKELEISRPQSARTIRWFVEGGYRLFKNIIKYIDEVRWDKFVQHIDELLELNKNVIDELTKQINSFSKEANGDEIADLIKNLKKEENISEAKYRLAEFDKQYENISLSMKNESNKLNTLKKSINKAELPKQNNELQFLFNKLDKVDEQVDEQIELIEKMEIDLKFVRADLDDKKVAVLKQDIDNFELYNKEFTEEARNYDINELSGKERSTLTNKEKNIIDSYNNLNDKLKEFEISYEDIADSRNKLYDIDTSKLTDEQLEKIRNYKGEGKFKSLANDIEDLRTVVSDHAQYVARNYITDAESIIKGDVPNKIANYLELDANYNNNIKNNELITAYGKALEKLIEDLFKVANGSMDMNDVITKMSGRSDHLNNYGKNIEPRAKNIFQIKPNMAKGGTTRGYICAVKQKLVLLSVGVETKSGSSTAHKAIENAAKVCQNL